MFDPSRYATWQIANARQIFAFFRTQTAPNGVRLQPWHAAAFVEQADAESSFEPNVWGDDDTAYGWFQFHGDRLGSACKALGFHTPVFGSGALTGAQQLGVAWHDLTGAELIHLNSILKAETAYDAGYLACKLWERAASPGQPNKRGQGAQAWLAYLTAHP